MAVIKWLASPADYLSVWRDMRITPTCAAPTRRTRSGFASTRRSTRWGRRARPGMCSIPPASPSCIATGAGRSRITARARSWPMRCSTCGASTCTSRNTSRCSRARSSTRWPRPAGSPGHVPSRRHPSCIDRGASRVTARARSWPMRCSTCGASTCTSRNTSRCSRARSSTRWPRPAWRAPQARRAGRVCAGSRWRRRAGQDRRAGHQDPQRPRLSRVSLNVDMDLAPFLGINPCGYAGLRTVDMAACGVRRELADGRGAGAQSGCRLAPRTAHGGRRRTCSPV